MLKFYFASISSVRSHLYKKREGSGSGSVPLTKGSGCGSPTLVPSLKLFANFDNFLGEECVHTAGEVSALPLYKRPGLASGLSPYSPGKVVHNNIIL